MSDSPQATLVLELADVVGELTIRQNELLSCVKRFRVDFLDAQRTDSFDPPPAYFLPPPPTPTAVVIGTWGPDIRSGSHGPHHGALPLPAGAPPRPFATLPLPPSASPDVEMQRGGSAPNAPAAASPADFAPTAGVRLQAGLHPTKRNYDYFAELDDVLARLPLETQPQERGPYVDQ